MPPSVEKRDFIAQIQDPKASEEEKTAALETLVKQEISRRNEVLVDLINAHNPYTKNDSSHMTVFTGNPDPAASDKNDISHIELEVDGPYSMGPMEWNFKGSPQKINKTIRVKYRYLARDLGDPQKPLLEPSHWVTAYLLIGYEDGGA
jgi:hypothetical protein